MLWGTLIASFGLILPMLLPGRAGLYGSQLITGSAFTFFILAAQKTVGTQSSNAWVREQKVAVYSMGVALGGFFGPIPAGFLGEFFGYERAFLALGLLMLVALFFTQRLPADPAAQVVSATPERRSNPLQVLAYHQFMGRAFLISSLVLLGKDMYVAYFPIYAVDKGLSASVIGIIIGLHNGGGVVMRSLLLPLTRHFGKNRVVIFSILGSGALFLVLPLFQDPILLTLVSLGIGLGLGLGQPLSMSTTIALSPVGKIGETLGLRLSFNRLTQVVTPLGFGGIVLITGLTGTFTVVGAILLLGSLRLSIPDSET